MKNRFAVGTIYIWHRKKSEIYINTISQKRKISPFLITSMTQIIYD